MTLGKKIKELRTKLGITQEQLAEKINVSRSAIAKWESDGGIPEIDSLKRLSDLFSVSIDLLISNDDIIEDNSVNKEKKIVSPYIGKVCDIDLIGWNEGVYSVLIVNEDDRFYYYLFSEGKTIKRGMIARKLICSMTLITSNRKLSNVDEYLECFDYSYFCNKPVSIELVQREGFIKGFFDCRSDDYQNVIISDFFDAKIKFCYGSELDITEISKIEER